MMFLQMDYYNGKQTREDRKIKDYFKHISQDKQKDLACEFIIELGDMDFWNYKDDYYKRGIDFYLFSFVLIVNFHNRLYYKILCNKFSFHLVFVVKILS